MNSVLKARLIMLGFAALAAGIGVNALILQTPRKPDRQDVKVNPMRPPEGRQRLEPPKPAAQPVKNAAAHPAPAEPPPLNTTSGIQRELRRRGYYAGYEDGQPQTALREAIIAYEFDRGMPLTGEPTQQFLKELLFAPFSPSPPQMLSPQRLEASVGLVRQVQSVLASLGYGPPAITGRVDDHTRAAIRQFQSERKMPANGILSERLLLELYLFTGHALSGYL